ncbi:Mu-like prophage major head subunit gpT family protein [Meridianimarinicoccus sp. RP-17]|uniref:Mu-like prophage major head subunit gpT family protein n=1 Tax=Meridianimarinicoccus zhengii TaxID=2056810 RepID=UPI000DAD5BE8|nr:Mu-like prophage major head subunit gpT family protein [Phycocomes zhengii]
MIINPQNLDTAFRGWKTQFNEAFAAGETHGERIAMTVPSSTREEAYGWLGQFPQLREWVGDRVVKDIKAHGFTITNVKFESTISISREDYADDRYGVFGSMFREMGHQAKVHPDELIFGLLAEGETTLCYDGQNFFDTDHPSVDRNGDAVTVSNILEPLGTDTPWYLFDTSRPIKPMIWQEREDYEFQMVNNHNDTGVFMTDLYHYGVRARVNAGFGLWHMAFMCKGPLNAANYKAARAAMMELRGDQGRVLGLKPDTLVVPPSLEEAARQIAVAQFDGAGASNVWSGTADVIVTPQLA